MIQGIQGIMERTARRKREMEISALQQFLVLAETLNFTQAAEKCFVTQPTLSRKIAVLENELGVRFFVRSRKSVMLTAEGSALVEHARRIVSEYEEILSITDPYRRGIGGSLKIGYSSYPFMLNIYMEVEERIKQRYPEIRTQITYGEFSENLEMLLEDQIDGIFILDCGLDKYPELVWEQVAPSRAYILVNHNHPLAGRERIFLEELTEEPFIVSNRENYPELFDFRIRYCMEKGIRPENIRYARNVKDVMVMVSRGEGVAVLNEDGQIDTIGTIHAIPLADAVPPVHLVFVWKKKKQSSCIGKFVEILREVRREG